MSKFDMSPVRLVTGEPAAELLFYLMRSESSIDNDRLLESRFQSAPQPMRKLTLHRKNSSPAKLIIEAQMKRHAARYISAVRAQPLQIENFRNRLFSLSEFLIVPACTHRIDYTTLSISRLLRENGRWISSRSGVKLSQRSGPDGGRMR